MLVLIKNVLSALRMNRALNSDADDSTCVACDGTDVTELGPGAYRCNACGYEGGSGFADLQRSQDRAKVDALSPAQRKASARSDLENARALLLGAKGTLSGANIDSTMDLVGLAGAGTQERQQEKQLKLVRAAGELQQATQLLDDALYKLGSVGAGVSLPELDPMLLNTEMFLDNLATDLAMHSRIRDYRRRQEQLTAVVDQLLQSL